MEQFFGLFNAALLSASLRVSTCLILGGLSYVICAQAGVTDMALEGKLLFGAFISIFITQVTGSQFLGLIGAMVFTAVYGYLLGLIMIKLHANQIIVGIGSNFLMKGITAVLLVVIWNNAGTSDNVGRLDNTLTNLLTKIPFIGKIFTRQTVIMLMAYILVILMAVFLNRTKAGLRLRAIGENPLASDSLGLNVGRCRLLACVVGGALCGLGGADLSLGQLGYFAKEMTSGRGYTALACAVVGRFKPGGTLITCMLVSLVEALQIRLQTTYNVSPEFFQIIPYVVPIVVITCFGGIKAPSGMGKAYKRGER